MKLKIKIKHKRDLFINQNHLFNIIFTLKAKIAVDIPLPPRLRISIGILT